MRLSKPSLSIRSTILIVTGLFFFSSNIFAMSDAEVISVAMSMYKSGYKETDIATALIEKGATMEQLQNLRDSYQKQQTTSTDTPSLSDPVVQTQRTNTTILPEIQRGPVSPASKQIFGHDFFTGESSKFEPSLTLATPQDYTLGAGDQVLINIFGASQKSFIAEISPDGFITIDGYGPIHLSGLTIAAATRKLKATIGSRFQNSQLMLSLGQSRSISVHVMGELNYPGSYQMTAFANVLYALYIAGGIRQTGTLRSIKVYRENALVSTVDLYDYLINGSTKTNIRLQDGDVILVSPYTELVSIKGNVKRPIFYEMLPNETVHNLIYYAGGFTGDAYTDAVRVMRRHTESGFTTHTVPNTELANFRLMDGDTVQVEAILDRPQNMLEIQGAVFRPGFYGLSGNLHTVKQLIEMAHGPIEQAIPARSVLYRMKFDRTYEVIQVDAQAILQGTAPDIELNNEDRLFIPSRERQLDHFTVTIHGEVYEPGSYPYALNETLENIILRAGGLTDKASTSKVHIIRHLIDPSATEEPEKNTMLFSVSLEDSAAAASFFLEPFDEVYVRITPAYAPNQNVFVRGEVLYDGVYALKTKTDRISAIIAAAGGLTKYAYPEGARLIRKANEGEKNQQALLLKINAASSIKDSVNRAKLDIGDYYSVAINLKEALAHPGGMEDFILRDSDILIIPTITTTVHINGEVLFPNSVSFIQGKKAKFYINQAGGYSNLARKNKTYVIYPNGKVARASKATIMPGSEIIVPSKPEKAPMTASQWVGIASASASLASVAASLATLIVNATKK